MGGFKHWHEGLIHLPKVSQTHNYDCGAASLRAVAEYFGVGPEDEGEFIRLCKTSERHGTSPQSLVRAARHIGLRTQVKVGMTIRELRRFIEMGRPVICAIQAWGDEDDYEELQAGHYVVAIGHDERYILFEDPSIHDSHRGHLRHAEFERRWVDIDRKGRELEHLGIVLWRHDLPDEQRLLYRSKRIE